MPDDRAASIAAVHAAADRALAHAEATGEPVPQSTIDFLKAKVESLDGAHLEGLNGKIAALEKKVAQPGPGAQIEQP